MHFFYIYQKNKPDLTCPQEEKCSLSCRSEELGKQNALLHQQMDEMATRSRQLHQQQQQNLDLSFSEEGKTTEQILEILRWNSDYTRFHCACAVIQQLDKMFCFNNKTANKINKSTVWSNIITVCCSDWCLQYRFVRREKEIAEAHYEASEGETLRYKQRVEHQNRELKELQEALNAERVKMQVRDWKSKSFSLHKAECCWLKLAWFNKIGHPCPHQLTTKTLAEQQEQLKRLETITSLQETNKMLKVDRDKLEQELQQAQTKVKSRRCFILSRTFIMFHS